MTYAKMSAAQTSNEIEVLFTYDRALSRRAMSGWWQSVVPPVPFIQRSIIWAVIWFAIGIVAMLVLAAGYTPLLVVAGLLGAAVMVAGFTYLQRTRMSRFWDVIGQHWDKAGETRVVFRPAGLTVTDAVSRREYAWNAIDAVRPVRGGTVFRSGISMLVVPDTSLPDGMTAESFVAQIDGWRAA